MAKPGQVMRLYPDAIEDSLYAAYSLAVIYPLSVLSCQWLLRGGKNTTSLKVDLVSFLVPAFLIAIPLIHWWIHAPLNVYSMLRLSRLDSSYKWSQRYAYWRQLYNSGEMPPEVWAEIDEAYDHIYDEKSRLLYDKWGPDGAKMSNEETLLNFFTFYVLWFGIIYALTAPTRPHRARNWCLCGLIAICSLDVSIRLFNYDPGVCRFFPTMTPRECLLWTHRLFPVYVFGYVNLHHVLYIDMDILHHKRLRHMLQFNLQVVESLTEIRDFLQQEKQEQQVIEEQKEEQKDKNNKSRNTKNTKMKKKK